jgi:hypothetical protein
MGKVMLGTILEHLHVKKGVHITAQVQPKVERAEFTMSQSKTKEKI